MTGFFNENDHLMMIKAGVHLCATNKNFQMDQYVYDRNKVGNHILRLDKICEKLQLAARAIAAVENPKDVCVISSRASSQRAVLKFARYTGATPIAGRFTPGTFTNQIQKAFREPRLLIVSDPIADHQAVIESSFVNIPVIAFCNTDSIIKYVDIVIPCNNKGEQPIGLIWYLLAREVCRMKGVISRSIDWDVKVDLFIVRSQEEEEKTQDDELVPQESNTMAIAADESGFGPIGQPSQQVDDWQSTDNWA